MTTNNKTGIMN